MKRFKIWVGFGCIGLSVISGSFAHNAIAQTSVAAPLPTLEPLDLKLLAADPSTLPPLVTTPNTISPTGLTPPSLWWAEAQFGERLLTTWLAYLPNQTRPGRVDLVVNRQIWSLLDYLERYEFITHMGNVAQEFQYNTRIFNPQGEFLAAYTCNFTAPQPICDIRLDPGGKSGLRGRGNTPLLLQ